MKLILNKNNISLNNIKFIYRYRYIKLVYDLNNIYMNGIFIRITEFKVYKNKNYMYILLLNNDDINLINKIIIYINNYLKSNISLKNNIIRRYKESLNDEGDLGEYDGQYRHGSCFCMVLFVCVCA